jgi:uncharacterized membrane protein
MRCNLRRTLTTIIDVLLFCVLLFVVIVIVSGGYSLRAFGVNLSAHTVSNPARVLILLLLLRKLIDYQTRVSEIPLVRVLRRMLLNQKSMDEQPSYIHLAVMVLLYTVVMGVVVVMRHNSYHSTAQDLGIFDQLLWNVRSGHGLYSSLLDNRHFFGEHFSPILYPLSVLYFIWSSPRILLIFQTVALAVGAIPVWWLAEKHLGNRNWAAILALLYLCYPALRGVNLYDFHPVALATPLLLFAFWYLDERKYGIFFLFLFVAFLCKEEITEIVFIFGIYILLFHRRRILGASLAVAGIALFILIVGFVIPHFRSDEFGFFHRYDYLGDDFKEILTTLITRPGYVCRHVFTPEKRGFAARIFGPLGYTSLLSPSHLLLAVPTFLQSIMSSLPAQYSIKYQYTAPLTPFVFVSAVFGLKNLMYRVERLPRRIAAVIGRPEFRRVLALMLLLMSLIFFGRSPVGKFREYLPTSHTHRIEALLRRVPSTASVSALTTFVPHLSHREDIFMFPKTGKAEYVVLDSLDKWPLKKRDYFRTVRKLLDKAYEIEFAEKSLLLLRRTGIPSEGSELPSEFVKDYSDDN